MGKRGKRRLSQVIDLICSDGRYHCNCYQTFQKPRSSHAENGAATTKDGSSTDTKRNDAFEKLCDYLEENDECQYAFEESQNMFLQLSPKVEPYTDTHLKRKLLQCYGNSLNFEVLPGKRRVICFFRAAINILSDNWDKNWNSNNKAQEKLKVIKTAAAIIRCKIKSKSYDYHQFQTIEEICKTGAELVSEVLSVLITEFIQPTSKKKKKNTQENSKDEINYKKEKNCNVSQHNKCCMSTIIFVSSLIWNGSFIAQKIWFKGLDRYPVQFGFLCTLKGSFKI